MDEERADPEQWQPFHDMAVAFVHTTLEQRIAELEAHLVRVGLLEPPIEEDDILGEL